MGFVPFDMVGNEKFDPNNYRHRDAVIERNKRLEKAINEGISLNDKKLSVHIKIEANLQCLKCGTELTKKHQSLQVGNIYHFEVAECMPDLKCKCCGAKYTFSPSKEVYKITLPTTTKKAKK